MASRMRIPFMTSIIFPKKNKKKKSMESLTPSLVNSSLTGHLSGFDFSSRLKARLFHAIYFNGFPRPECLRNETINQLDQSSFVLNN